jgi:hypothetical protein
MKRWNNHSACEVIRHLAGRGTPYTSLRSVIAGLFEGKVPADGTFKIQMAAGRKEKQELNLGPSAVKQLAGLLEKHGPGGTDYVPDPPKAAKHRVYLGTNYEMPSTAPKHPIPDWIGMPDATWLAVLKERGEDDALPADFDSARIKDYRVRFNHVQTKKRPAPMSEDYFFRLQAGDRLLTRLGSPYWPEGSLYEVSSPPDGGPAASCRRIKDGKPWGTPVPLTHLAVSPIYTEAELKQQRKARPQEDKPRVRLEVEL